MAIHPFDSSNGWNFGRNWGNGGQTCTEMSAEFRAFSTANLSKTIFSENRVSSWTFNSVSTQNCLFSQNQVNFPKGEEKEKIAVEFLVPTTSQSWQRSSSHNWWNCQFASLVVCNLLTRNQFQCWIKDKYSSTNNNSS